MAAARLPKDETIYRDIYTAIVEHDLAPGAKLPEDHLADVFGVSRTQIRKVLLSLAHEGLVTLQRNRGASVARPSVEEAREVFATRRIIEPGMVAAIARCVDRSSIEMLYQFAEREQLAREERDWRATIKRSGEFHVELAKLLDNETLVAILQKLVSRTSLIIAIYETASGSGCRGEDHAELLGVLAAGNVHAAAAHMEAHLERVEASLTLGAIDRQPVNLREVFAKVAARRTE